MEFPYMLIMRNSHGGCIWQAYTVRDEKEVELLTKTATHNGFLVQKEQAGYTDETSPGWRDSQEWKDYRAGKLSEKALQQQRVREVLKPIRREGPYWLGGYKDWLVACFSIRSLEDMHGFQPLACWSELVQDESHPKGYCSQWLVCFKNGSYYVDWNVGYETGRGYGLKFVPAECLTYPQHVYDWVFKDVVPKHQTALLEAKYKQRKAMMQGGDEDTEHG